MVLSDLASGLGTIEAIGRRDSPVKVVVGKKNQEKKKIR